MFKRTIKDIENLVKDSAAGTYYFGKAAYSLGKLALKIGVIGGAILLASYLATSRANASDFYHHTLDNNIISGKNHLISQAKYIDDIANNYQYKKDF